MSLGKGIVSFILRRQKTFNQGQIYVALSTIRRIKNMFLIGGCNCAAIKVNALAGKEYPRLRKENQIETLPATQTKEDTLSMTLLNKLSLGKHLHDILIDKHLFYNYIIRFNETQL